MRAKFITPRLVELRGILARAKERGELTTVPSAETAASFVSGPAYHRAYVLRLPLTPRFLQTATAFALDGLGATTPATPDRVRSTRTCPTRTPTRPRSTRGRALACPTVRQETTVVSCLRRRRHR